MLDVDGSTLGAGARFRSELGDVNNVCCLSGGYHSSYSGPTADTSMVRRVPAARCLMHLYAAVTSLLIWETARLGCDASYLLFLFFVWSFWVDMNETS